ncbi:hypothetical protein AVEN_64775-1 [Araneus ventricosus]|uniref:Uncharacterized protein n=1 Tax=Araneus ventricosus TaxID=182803 RepID=A0A4Y2US74_ARAVE|nr:hypothetical protein AVEN_64775-1 [Araneus ventricosus]
MTFAIPSVAFVDNGSICFSQPLFSPAAKCNPKQTKNRSPPLCQHVTVVSSQGSEIKFPTSRNATAVPEKYMYFPGPAIQGMRSPTSKTLPDQKRQLYIYFRNFRPYHQE